MTDLSLVLLDEIIEELKKRYDGFVLVSRKMIDDNTEEFAFNFSGGKTLAVGLCECAKEKIRTSVKGEVV